jgi:hypothetical protein
VQVYESVELMDKKNKKFEEIDWTSEEYEEGEELSEHKNQQCNYKLMV